MPTYVTLTEWAKSHFEIPPCKTTLRAWAKAGRIRPKPFKARAWMVRKDAEIVDLDYDDADLSPLAKHVIDSL